MAAAITLLTVLRLPRTGSVAKCSDTAWGKVGFWKAGPAGRSWIPWLGCRVAEFLKWGSDGRWRRLVLCSWSRRTAACLAAVMADIRIENTFPENDSRRLPIRAVIEETLRDHVGTWSAEDPPSLPVRPCVVDADSGR